MWLAVIAVLIGLAILVWSADLFVDGATALAKIRRALNEYERQLNKTHSDEV